MYQVTCEYCGNTSGKVDSRGMCVSCGGNLTQAVEAKQPFLEYSDSSGGFTFIPDYAKPGRFSGYQLTNRQIMQLAEIGIG